MKSYTQLTEEIRCQIPAYMKAEFTQTETSLLIGVHKSTMSRELNRNSDQVATDLNRRMQRC